VTKPSWASNLQLIDALCQRWGCPPSVVLREDARLVMHMMWLLAEDASDDDKQEA
jgi:hypothetical protein